MSSFFKQSFQSKQSKEFIELSIKAIPTIKQDAANTIYKSIKHGNNKQWNALKPAMKCLQRKVRLNTKITTYQTIVNNEYNNSDRVIKSAKSHLTRLLQSKDTKRLLRTIERGFKLRKGLLIKQITPSNKLSTHTPIPNMKTKQYLHFLLENALTNKAWNDNDADILCKCAISNQCDWITVHSMWVDKCYQLLLKYTLLKCKDRITRHRKSKRRGSKMPLLNEYMDEGNTIYDTKICVAIAHPFGQASTASKVAETTQAINDGANKIRLMVSAGKLIMNDWECIEQEVRTVVDAANGVKVDVVFPDHSRITEDIKKEFNRRIVKEISLLAYHHTKRNTRKAAYSSTATDDTDGHAEEITKDKTDDVIRKKSNNESDDSESSVTDLTPKGQHRKQRKMNRKRVKYNNMKDESDSNDECTQQIKIGMSVTESVDVEPGVNSPGSNGVKARKTQKRKKRVRFHDDVINKSKTRHRRKKCRDEEYIERNEVKRKKKQRDNRRHQHRKRKSNKSKKDSGHRRCRAIYS